jgi:hypothetical protein
VGSYTEAHSLTGTKRMHGLAQDFHVWKEIQRNTTTRSVNCDSPVTGPPSIDQKTEGKKATPQGSIEGY